MSGSFVDAGQLLRDERRRAAQALAACSTPDLLGQASAIRDSAWGRTITWSPKAFLPVTNLCRNRCDYCTFRRSPGDAGEWTMSPDEVTAALDRAAAARCIEALLCLGDTPETAFASYRRLLGSWGFESTVDYLCWIGDRALERGLLPHTNAGILTRNEMARLRPTNVSMGLMLESTSERLCAPGGVHHRAPDKRPERRLQMLRDAAREGIAMTTGLLVGIGETLDELLDTIVALSVLSAAGHVQEVIVQNFRAHPGTRAEFSREPDAVGFVRAVALTRILLPSGVSVQAPPNLLPCPLGDLLAAGINDLGGISPITPDFINPRFAWPHLDALADELAAEGFTLSARLPVYDSHRTARWVDPRLDAHLERAEAVRRGWNVRPQQALATVAS